ncbi:MAG: CDP-diacylglycerol--glycerol-3-phosphate 3-phosphatidyltransferase [Nitrospirae bacterium]|nr:CDP-diacylglycerol--glycerol-3-phosphate 3-phosphatidyltransferase [Nitrospirota bacterium]MBI3392253.1 CDP-diacylglycerol--glycerol-3-phosphate 3-phosphatidyltransferase [Nitrospirota bacterium]
MNLPNLVTVTRIVLIPVFIILLVYGPAAWALAAFSFAGVTDALDGYLARRLGEQTALGGFLDPLADKLLLNSAFVTMGALGQFPIWLVVIVISRDVAITLGSLLIYLVHHGTVMAPTVFGKATTLSQLLLVVSQLVLMSTGFAHPLHFPVLAVTAALTVVSGIHYIVRGIRFSGGSAATKGAVNG